ncbi:MAG: response regulator transcription factor [Chloroflexi bacterium]|nr:response regulator transcription factor [Chloroflexota bacterium]
MAISHVLIVAAPDRGAILATATAELGASPVSVSTIERATLFLERIPFDIIVVQVGAQFADGINVIRRARFLTRIPVLALADPQEGAGIIEALDAGAADYLTAVPKRDEWQQLLTGVQGKAPAASAPEPAGGVARIRHLAVDFDRREVSVGESSVKLTPTEFRLLATLVGSAGKVLSAGELARELYEDEIGPEDARKLLKDHLRRLRAKLKPLEGERPYIVNVRGFGYMLERRAALRPGDFLGPRPG